MHPSFFDKRIRPSSRLPSKNRPPPSKSCLAASCSDRGSSPSGEPHVRKTVHFPDDNLFLQRIKTIPPRERQRKAILKRGQITEIKWFLMYTLHSSGSNQRFLRKLVGRHSHVRYATRPRWVSIIALPEPASAGSLPGSAFNMSSMLHALPVPDPTFNMTSLMDALPDPNTAFGMRALRSTLSESAPEPHGFASDMSSLIRALPGPDASSDVSSLAHVPKSMVASHSRKSHKIRPVRVLETHVEVGPFSVTCLFNLCGFSVVVMCFFPWITPITFVALVLLFIYGTSFF
ncbi:hypothetical protein N7463_008564 [Penicillium fimorum]|uniref:Uncharacterized protein n=1 Tax=Penicillium fimorum TaxID=1882269 RepID=A0A9W9XP45_9EURO|nr:hypothetical protein N7463_008564 [Penicillium fimorum]